MNRSYAIPDTFMIAQSDCLFASPFLILRDKQPKRTELEKLFDNAYKIFRIRVRDLGKRDMPLTRHDANALRVSLESLISAKERIQRERGE